MTARITSTAALLIVSLTCVGCVDLDFTIHNGKHCSTYGTETCDVDDPWDKLCTPCDAAFDWAREYPWTEGEYARAVVDARQERVPSWDGEGELDAYFIPAHGERPELADTTIMYFHGNRYGLEHYAPRVRLLHEAGYAVFAVDYRGYGKSEPESWPTAAQWFDDAEALRERLDELGVDLTRVVYYGYSIGAFPAIELAGRSPACAVVLEAPCPGVDPMVAESSLTSVPGSFLATGDYDNARKLGELEQPLFIMHGENDSTFSTAQSRQLFSSAVGPKRFWEVPGAEHGVSDGVAATAGNEVYFERIERFLVELAPSCL